MLQKTIIGYLLAAMGGIVLYLLASMPDYTILWNV